MEQKKEYTPPKIEVVDLENQASLLGNSCPLNDDSCLNVYMP